MRLFFAIFFINLDVNELTGENKENKKLENINVAYLARVAMRLFPPTKT